MNRQRKLKIVVAICVFIIFFCLSIGFASYSKRISISTTATVLPNDDMVVLFSSSNSLNDGSVVTNPISAVPVQYEFGSGSEHTATIDNSNVAAPKIRGLKAYFSDHNQTVTYTFYVYNSWVSNVYLKSISYDSSKSCSAIEGGLSSDATIRSGQVAQIEDACSGITLSVKVGNDSFVTGSTSNISGHALAAHSFEPVIVKIQYGEESTIADIDFSVSFGSITLNYSSLS